MNTVTGQQSLRCNHIIGWFSATYPQYGEVDYLIRAGQECRETERFNYCPLCGGALLPRKNTSVASASAALTMTLEASSISEMEA